MATVINKIKQEFNHLVKGKVAMPTQASSEGKYTSLQLGNIELARQTISHEEQQGYDFATYDIATGKPVISKIGMQLKTITLNVSLRQYNDFDVEAILQQLKAILQSGNANTLIIGDDIQGDFVIKNIRQQTKHIATDGQLRSADLTIELLEYEPRQVLQTKQVEHKPVKQTNTKRKTTGKVSAPQKKHEQIQLYKIEIKNIAESTYVKPPIL